MDNIFPYHVAVIMDGNGRWASQRNLPRNEGHRAGTENIRRVIEAFAKHHIKYLTLYAFSTENWSRPPLEVQGLMDILEEVIDREVSYLHKQGVKLRHIGRLDRLPKSLQESVRRAVELTRENSSITVNAAFDYGGRAELVEVIRRLIMEGISPDQIDEETVSRYLYTAGIPDPDLIIRTGGEMRVSNFLLWQAAYSEYFYTPVLWPDFGEKEVNEVLNVYAQRQRRFGGVNPQ